MSVERSPFAPFFDVLNLIASGAPDDKMRWIAEHDPDWFVARVLDRTLGVPHDPRRGIRVDERDLDQAIASITLRECVARPLRATA